MSQLYNVLSSGSMKANAMSQCVQGLRHSLAAIADVEAQLLQSALMQLQGTSLPLGRCLAASILYDYSFQLPPRPVGVHSPGGTRTGADVPRDQPCRGSSPHRSCWFALYRNTSRHTRSTPAAGTAATCTDQCRVEKITGLMEVTPAS